jgi:peroxiredoxin
VLIDHILYRSFTGTTDASRILDGPLTVTVNDTPVETAYSDHFGVQVTFVPDPPAQD